MTEDFTEKVKKLEEWVKNHPKKEEDEDFLKKAQEAFREIYKRNK